MNISMAPPEDFGDIANLGAGSVGTRRRKGAEVRDLTVLMSQAEAQGLRLFVQSEGRGWFQTGDKRFDYQKLYDVIYAAFGDNDVASDPDFIGYYIVDEPCNPQQWSGMTQQDMAQFYDTVKSVDPNIPVAVNYGHPSCLERFVPSNCPAPPGADVALVTIDPVKWKWPGYMDEVHAAAAAMKACDPDVKVVVAIAVYGLPIWGDLPSPDYVRETGFAVLADPALDGFIYFSWSPDPYMTASISDVADDPAYISAFADVFNAARQ